jgi:hypothetical protein
VEDHQSVVDFLGREGLAGKGVQQLVTSVACDPVVLSVVFLEYSVAQLVESVLVELKEERAVNLVPALGLYLDQRLCV